MATTQSNNRLAVLIDADNAQPSVIEGLLAEVAKLGVASVKRIYGDWTSTGTTQWKQSLLRYSITPVQQFAYTKGKNATDASLIIDAMDLMHTHRFGGFCLVSSDSDFTALARRLREEGLVVYGFGEKKTPDAFVAACDKFIYTEVLRPASAEGVTVPAGGAEPVDSEGRHGSAGPAERRRPPHPASRRASTGTAGPDPTGDRRGIGRQWLGAPGRGRLVYPEDSGRFRCPPLRQQETE